MKVTILPVITGERAWRAADRAAGCNGHLDFDKIESAPYGVWAEIGHDAANEALEVLPPLRFPGGFMVSEAICEGPDGTMYLAVASRHGRCFAAYRPRNTRTVNDALDVFAQVAP